MGARLCVVALSGWQVALVALSIALVSARAEAQSTPTQAPPPNAPRPERPYRGLFGGGRADLSQSLVIGGGLGAAHVERLDGTVAFDANGNQVPAASTFGYGSANAGYSLSLPRLTFGASVLGLADFQPRNDIIATRYSANIGGRYTATQNLMFSTGLGVAPLSGQTALQSLTDLSQAPPHDDIENVLQSNGVYIYSFSASVGYSRPITSRLSFVADYGYSTGFYTGQVVDLSGHTANVGVSFAITRNLRLHTGYVYSLGFFTENGVTTITRSGRFDIGIDYSKGKTLKLARRTTLTFNGGLGAASDGRDVHANVVGNISLHHEIGRTWSAVASYGRSFGFVTGFLDPVLSDNVNVQFGGLIHRRLQFSSSAGAGRGLVGFGESGDNDFYTTSAGANLTYGISQHVALMADYSYYRSQFDSGVPLVPGLLPYTAVQVFRVNLALTAPLLQTRRRNATR